MDNNPGFKLSFICILIVGAILALTMGEFTYGLDLKGGSTLTYSLDITEKEQDDPGKDVVSDTIKVLQKRLEKLNRSGVVDIGFVPVGNDQIMVQLPGMDKQDADTIKKVLTDLGVLEWKLLANPTEFAQRQVDIDAENAKRAQMEEEAATLEQIGKRGPRYIGPTEKGIGWYYVSKGQQKDQGVDGYFCLLDEDSSVGGDQIDGVYLDYDRSSMPGVGFQLRASGAGRMRALTEKNKGRQMAIILNGEVHTAPTIEGTISDRGIITGGLQGFGREELSELIATLRSGSLEIKPRLESEYQIGPTLGEEAIQRGFTAILTGFVLVIIFMLLIYRLAGLVAVIALITNLLFIMGWLSFSRGTLTLPGLAGILLTVGMAVDASILIFERIREEREKGKTLIQSFQNGFQLATVTILDANITTFLTALCLWFIGTGPIKGFATTLMVGIVCTLLTGVFAARIIFTLLLQKGIYKEFSAVKLFKNPNIDFLKFSRIAFIASVIAITLGLVVFVTYEDKADLDFSGGTLVRINCKAPLNSKDVRERIGAKYEDSIVYPLGDSAGPGQYSQFELRAKIFEDAAQAEFSDSVRALFKDDLVPDGMTVNRLSDDIALLDDKAKDYPGGFHFLLNTRDATSREIVEKSLSDAGSEKYNVIGDRQGESTHFEAWVGTLGPTVDEAGLRVAVRSGLEKQGVVLSNPFPKTDFISPKAVEELTRKAILAILASLVLILLYILFRFHDIRFGYSAVAALVHDVVFTMGMVALFDMLGIVDAKLNLPIIAAFLTIIGYSLNDTIVIFDRIREKLKKTRLPLREIVNLSINETLARTIFTSVTTFLVVFCLFILNKGQRSVLEGLAFALMLGIVAGTYSTIYVASSMVVFLRSRGRSNDGSNENTPAATPAKKKQVPAAQA